MDKTKSIKNWGWSIPDILLERTDLDMYEKVLIAIMGRLGALEKPIFPRQKWLAEKMGISESGIRKILKRLQNKKIVKYEGKKWKIAIYSLTDLIGWSSPTQQDGDSQTHQDTHKKDIQSKDIQIKISEQSSPVSLIRNYFINQCKLLKNFEPAEKIHSGTAKRPDRPIYEVKDRRGFGIYFEYVPFGRSDKPVARRKIGEAKEAILSRKSDV